MDIEYIREAFLSAGYLLLADEYINSRTKLSFVCNKGHAHSMTWNDFQSGQRCGVCFAKRKHTVEFIRSEMGKEGYTLKSRQYTGNRYALLVECPNGHSFYAKWNYFRSGNRCPFCSGRNKSLDDTIDRFLEHGFTLVSFVYKGSRNKYRVVCERGHEHSVPITALSNKHLCCRFCRGEDRRRSFEYITGSFHNAGFEVLSSEYLGAHTPLLVKCPKGHITHKRWNSFRGGSLCSVCSSTPVSKISQDWLDGFGISTEHREVWVVIENKSVRVDGFDPKTNTVYEFLGDYWHGNPKKFDGHSANSRNKRLFIDLYNETMGRLSSIVSSGYNLIYVWESDYKEGKMVSNGPRKYKT